MNVSAYDTLIPSEAKEDLEHPYQFCFQLFVESLLHVANNDLEPPLGDGDKVDFHFDQQTEMELRARQTFGVIKCLRDSFSRLGSISFDDRCDLIPLQAADLLAYVMRQSASRKLHGDWRIKPDGWEHQLIQRKNVVMRYYDHGTFKDFLTGMSQ